MVLSELSGARVVVMGLGLHGGGLQAANFCIAAGADVVVTDLKSRTELEPIVNQIDGRAELVLGAHREEDFKRADFVIKNPAVPRSSRYLDSARRVETDISLFLCAHRGPVYAITGSKGKSTTATALHRMIEAHLPSARLGGNITISPLSFLNEIDDTVPVVLELSSFQIGDLRLTSLAPPRRIAQLAIAGITTILPDHQDYYDSMEAYVADKRALFSLLPDDGFAVMTDGDEYSRAISPPRRWIRVEVGTDTAGPVGGASGRGRPAGRAWLESQRGYVALGDEPAAEVVPDRLLVTGAHQRRNLLFAAACARAAAVPAHTIANVAAAFSGIAHRMETVAKADGITYVNDSAATIPEAALAAVSSYSAPVHLIAGGSDKRVSLDLFREIAAASASVHLLAGSATERITAVLDRAKLRYAGPFDSLQRALGSARGAAASGSVVLLSPGCASFGMFANEFDRGEQFRSRVRQMAGGPPDPRFRQARSDSDTP